MDLVINWIKVEAIIYITILLVSVMTETSVVKLLSKILAIQLAVQMISQVMSVSAFLMKRTSKACHHLVWCNAFSTTIADPWSTTLIVSGLAAPSIVSAL